ncbi:MAG TPA: Crp/Fnr family transcriptional regulator [Phycisphaerae bacterium]|nr:Crp/Fnr family transcriptional regulator [Phycisphaerae bacterium]HOI53964.1 Crp/Fnr family transcriptional regulator [Phycisphaerae bacterium]
MIGTECPECATDLARVTLFESLPPKDLLQLATVVRREHFPRDATLFLQGQRADRFYVLVEGAVKLFRTSPDGRQQILHTVMPPNAFAEAAVFAGGRYPAHAVAMKPSECLLLPRCEFVHLLGRHPELTMRVLASMSRRLQDFVSLIEDLSLREVSARLARYLLQEAERHGRRKFRLAMPKGELARQLGTTPETLSRTFTRMDDRGLLSTSGQTVHLLDADRLAALLEQ